MWSQQFDAFACAVKENYPVRILINHRHPFFQTNVFSATSLEGSIPLVTDEDPGIRNASFTRSSVRLRDMDRTRC